MWIESTLVPPFAFHGAVPRYGTRYNAPMKDDIVRILIPDRKIKARVSELGREMADMYDSQSGLTIVAILNGALIFLADLMREIPLNRPTGKLESPILPKIGLLFNDQLT